ncbi:MAG: EAL domain-containing protein [Gammaproteobacteria bacterium]
MPLKAKSGEGDGKLSPVASHSFLECEYSPNSSKEYNYIFQISEEDRQLLEKHQASLVYGSAGFAESIYQYLFDNPDIAGALFEYERQGGNISNFVKNLLEHLFMQLQGKTGQGDMDCNIQLAQSLQSVGMIPSWLLGCYRLYLDHLSRLVANNTMITADEKSWLSSCLIKLVMRDYSAISDIFWCSAISEYATHNSQISQRLQHLDAMMEAVSQEFWVVDIESGDICCSSPWISEICQRDRQTIPLLHLLSENDQIKISSAWNETLGGVQLQASITLNLDAQSYPARLTFYPVTGKSNSVSQVYCVLEKSSTGRNNPVVSPAFFPRDPVTSMIGRLEWYASLEDTLTQCETSEKSFGIIKLDLQDFKRHIKVLGQKGGNELLRQVAIRLLTVPGAGNKTGRLDGDEFGLIVTTDVDVADAVAKLSAKIALALTHVFVIDDKEVALTAAFGFAIFPLHGKDSESLSNHADEVLVRQKLCYSVYTLEKSENTANLYLANNLSKALKRNEFILHYQPRVDATTNAITCADALLRWHHPDLGLISPGVFIPVMERLGLMEEVTHWVMQTACQQSDLWASSGQDIPVSVNLSNGLFQSNSLAENIQLMHSGKDERRKLEIEISESFWAVDFNQSVNLLSDLNAMGVDITIDNFGAGMSSLSCLKQLPVSAFKIDRSLLQNLTRKKEDQALVRSIIELAHNFNCRVIAQGVEEKTVYDQLKEMGCDQIQGYLISRPMTSETFTSWIVSNSFH